MRVDSSKSMPSICKLTVAVVVLCTLRCGTDEKPSKSSWKHHSSVINEADYSSSPLPADPTPGTVWKNSLGTEYVFIAPGEFVMGSPEDENGRSADEILHRVQLTQGFWIARTETTSHDFLRFLHETEYVTDSEKLDDGVAISHQLLNPVLGTPKSPADCVSWNDAQEFARWLSKKESVTYRLPTEAEWEYVCRAGTTTPYSAGERLSAGRDANFGGLERRGDPAKMDVASFPPNQWGVYDMHGSVVEWCEDRYGPYEVGDPVVGDPKGAAEGEFRVFRGGGSWQSMEECRCARRRRTSPDFAIGGLGFRLVITIEEQKAPQ